MLESWQRLRRIQTAKLRKTETDTRDCFSKKKLDTARPSELGAAQTSTGFKVDSTGQLHIQLENQERLLRLTSISDPNKACCLTWSIGDYQDVEIEDNSVLYCDVPYENTNKYVGEGENFDYERFYDWCLKQKQPLYISSYEMPEKDFKVVAEFARIDTMSATNNGKLVSEKLFMPRTQETKGNIQLSLF